MATQLAPVRDATDAARAAIRTGAAGVAASAAAGAASAAAGGAESGGASESGAAAPLVGDAAGGAVPLTVVVAGASVRTEQFLLEHTEYWLEFARAAPQPRGGTHLAFVGPDVVVAEEDVGVKKKSGGARRWRRLAPSLTASAHAEPLAAYLSRLPERAPLLVIGFNTGWAAAAARWRARGRSTSSRRCGARTRARCSPRRTSTRTSRASSRYSGRSARTSRWARSRTRSARTRTRWRRIHRGERRIPKRAGASEPAGAGKRGRRRSSGDCGEVATRRRGGAARTRSFTSCAGSFREGPRRGAQRRAAGAARRGGGGARGGEGVGRVGDEAVRRTVRGEDSHLDGRGRHLGKETQQRARFLGRTRARLAPILVRSRRS